MIEEVGDLAHDERRIPAEVVGHAEEHFGGEIREEDARADLQRRERRHAGPQLPGQLLAGRRAEIRLEPRNRVVIKPAQMFAVELAAKQPENYTNYINSALSTGMLNLKI